MFLVDKLPKESVETTEETLGIVNFDRSMNIFRKSITFCAHKINDSTALKNVPF